MAIKNTTNIQRNSFGGYTYDILVGDENPIRVTLNTTEVQEKSYQVSSLLHDLKVLSIKYHEVLNGIVR